jgi:hypothetical protein
VPGDGSTALVTGVPNEAVGGGLLLLLAGGAWVLARRTGETTDAGPEVTVTTTGADGDGGATSDTADGGDAPTGGTDGGPGDDETPDGDEPSTGDADTAAVAAGGASGASDEDDAAAETGRSTGADGPPDSIPTAGSLDLSFEDLERGECLGGGGSADVYRATTPDGTELALKLPRFHGTLHRETMEQFTKEAETWAKLDDHEAVVGVHDWGTSPKPWLALEYMAGGPLDARAGSLSHRQATWTALQIVEGVRHAHEHGIAHLDLKPANVLFREVGDGWDAPKVADWGLARLLLEESGSVEGLSPSYAAPEQFDRDRFGEPGTATDIYQLGTVVYELFTGEPPVTGSGSEAMFSVLEDEVTPPTQVAAVPPALDDIVAQATAKQPAERYEAVYYLRDDLRDLYESL